MVRRSLGVVVCFSPVLLLIASLVAWFAGREGGLAGLGLAVIGLLFGVLNAYLSFFRPWLYRRRRGSMEGYRFVSGLPLFGTLFVGLSGVFGFGEPYTTALGLTTLAIDTGGLPWFLVSTWRDESLWDAEPARCT
jgi:hypothetical protein